MYIIRFVMVLILTLCFSYQFLYAAQLEFTPFVIASEQYDDNIFLSPNNEEDDFITTLSLGMEARLQGRTNGVELHYVPSYEWYKDNSDFDGWIHNGLFRFWQDFSANTHLEIRNSYLQSRDPLGEGLETGPADPLAPPDITPDLLRRGREEYRRNEAILRLDHRFGSEDTVYTTFTYSILQGVGRNQLTDDNTIWEPAIGGTYWFSNFWGFETDMYYSNRDYDTANDREEWYGRFRLNRRIDRHLNVYAQYEQTILDYTEGASVDYDVYNPTLGFSYQLDSNTRIDIGAGYYWQEFDDDLFDDEDGFLVTALADKVWPFRSGLFGVTLLSGYDIEDRGVADLGLNLYYQGMLRGEYRFSPRFLGTSSISYRWDEYPNTETDRTDKTLHATAGLEYQVLRWMFMNLNYDYEDRSSDISFDEYTDNRVTFTLTLRPDQPFKTDW